MLLETLLIFIFGLFIGSFLGVVIDRLPHNKPILVGRSHCEVCKKTLGAIDLFPVLSFIILKGKCRFCKSKLSLFYPIIELVTAFLFSLTFYAIVTPLTQFNYKFIIYFSYLFLMVSSFIVIFFIDLRHGIIPDKILIFDTVLTLIWFILNPFPVIFNHLLSGLGSLAFFIAVSYIFYMVTKKEGMGGGDVKMSFVLGLFLGFPQVVISLYLAFIIGAIFALFLIISRKKTFKGSLPFGPFLIVGAFMSLFFQNQIYEFFIRLFGV